jgi:hypothetical protein
VRVAFAGQSAKQEKIEKRQEGKRERENKIDEMREDGMRDGMSVVI